ALWGARGAAAPDAEVEAPAADVVDGGDILGDPQGLVQRVQVDGGADAQPPRAAGDGPGQNERRGEHRAGDVEVDLAQPDAVEAPGLGRVDHVELVLEGLRRRAAGPGLLQKDPDVHVQQDNAPGPSVCQSAPC